MDLSKVKINDIVWTKRVGGHGNNGNADISVFRSKESVNFTFRNNVIPSLSDTGYIQIGILGDALLFKESDKYTGHKPTKKETSNGSVNYHLHISDTNVLKWIDDNNGIGDYHARLFKNYIYIDEASKIDY